MNSFSQLPIYKRTEKKRKKKEHSVDDFPKDPFTFYIFQSNHPQNPTSTPIYSMGPVSLPILPPPTSLPLAYRPPIRIRPQPPAPASDHGHPPPPPQLIAHSMDSQSSRDRAGKSCLSKTSSTGMGGKKISWLVRCGFGDWWSMVAVVAGDGSGK